MSVKINDQLTAEIKKKLNLPSKEKSLPQENSESFINIEESPEISIAYSLINIEKIMRARLYLEHVKMNPKLEFDVKCFEAILEDVDPEDFMLNKLKDDEILLLKAMKPEARAARLKEYGLTESDIGL